MKLLITGATGFIGSHTVAKAIARGHSVVGLRRSTLSRPRISLPEITEWLEKPLDALAPDDFHGVDSVIHLAAHTPNIPYDTLENCLYWNVTAALKMARAAQESGVRKFVVAGTCFEYGTSGERYDYIPVDAPLEPTLTYPASKAASWIAFRQFAIETGVTINYHRIFQVYGEGEDPSRLWPSLRKAAQAGNDFKMTPAEQVRDFIPVEDVADALLDSTETMDEIGGISTMNLGTGVPLQLRDFAVALWNGWHATGRLLIGSNPYRPGEVMRYVPEI